MTVTKDLAKKRIEELRIEVREHDERYDNCTPIISDLSYDRLYAELVELETSFPEFYDSNSPTQKISLAPVAGLTKVKHDTPLLSLEKTTTTEGITKFMSRSQGEDVLVQEKLDGLTILLHYVNGVLFDAITRGSSGIEGERVLHTVSTIRNIPKQIAYKGTLKLRCEVVVPFEEFERINVDGKYSNPRNLAAGTVRQLDPSVAASRGLRAIVFDVIEGPSHELDSVQMKAIEQLGFEVVTTYHCKTVNDVTTVISNYENGIRAGLPYMIDGLVLKVNKVSLRTILGTASKYPKWAIAFKFKSLDDVTTLNSITWQIGKTGQITPVAEFTEVEIDSVSITRATLHNAANIKTKDIRIGDKVVIQRANDVIPQVVKSLAELRNGLEVEPSIPTRCPSCGAPTEFKGENLYCTGTNCLPQLEGKIKHFVSTEALNIDGLGGKTVEDFISKGFLTSILDIYNLEKHKYEICNMKGYGEKKFQKIIDGVTASKSRHLHHFIYGLSIDLIGSRASLDIASHFKTMENILELSKKPEMFKREILKLGNFGEIMADSLVAYFSSSENVVLVNALIEKGLNTQAEITAAPVHTNSFIKSKVFVITGDVTHFANRKELKAKIESLGGKVASSITKQVDYLINNSIESTSSKNKDAKKFSIPIITEEEFLSLMESPQVVAVSEPITLENLVVETPAESSISSELPLDAFFTTPVAPKVQETVSETVTESGQLTFL